MYVIHTRLKRCWWTCFSRKFQWSHFDGTQVCFHWMSMRKSRLLKSWVTKLQSVRDQDGIKVERSRRTLEAYSSRAIVGENRSWGALEAEAEARADAGHVWGNGFFLRWEHPQSILYKGIHFGVELYHIRWCHSFSLQNGMILKKTAYFVNFVVGDRWTIIIYYSQNA